MDPYLSRMCYMEIDRQCDSGPTLIFEQDALQKLKKKAAPKVANALSSEEGAIIATTEDPPPNGEPPPNNVSRTFPLQQFPGQHQRSLQFDDSVMQCLTTVISSTRPSPSCATAVQGIHRRVPRDYRLKYGVSLDCKPFVDLFCDKEVGNLETTAGSILACLMNNRVRIQEFSAVSTTQKQDLLPGIIPPQPPNPAFCVREINAAVRTFDEDMLNAPTTFRTGCSSDIEAKCRDVPPGHIRACLVEQLPQVSSLCAETELSKPLAFLVEQDPAPRPDEDSGAACCPTAKGILKTCKDVVREDRISCVRRETKSSSGTKVLSMDCQRCLERYVKRLNAFYRVDPALRQECASDIGRHCAVRRDNAPTELRELLDSRAAVKAKTAKKTPNDPPSGKTKIIAQVGRKNNSTREVDGPVSSNYDVVPCLVKHRAVLGAGCLATLKRKIARRFDDWRLLPFAHSACEGDVGRFCDAVTPGNKQVRACLQKHLKILSSSCRNQEFPSQIISTGTRPAILDHAIRAHCASLFVGPTAICSAARVPDHGVLACLYARRNDLRFTRPEQSPRTGGFF